MPRRLLLCLLPQLAFATLPASDHTLQLSLESAVARLNLEPLAAEGKLAISLIDLHSATESRYAGINDRRMMYAASLPKLGVLLAAFEAFGQRRLAHSPWVDAVLNRMIRQSSNVDTSWMIQRLGYGFISDTLTSPRYRLYDPEQGGGMWVGKSYGPSRLRGHVEFWRPEPVSGEWHAANTFQVARFFWLLDQGRLASRNASSAMRRILGRPESSDYFVEGLRAAGVTNGIYRKSGMYGDLHADAVLVDHGTSRYIAVGMVLDPAGPSLLRRLIAEIHSLIS